MTERGRFPNIRNLDKKQSDQKLPNIGVAKKLKKRHDNEVAQITSTAAQPSSNLVRRSTQYVTTINKGSPRQNEAAVVINQGSSDRQSDNESVASSSGIAKKKTNKNTAQKQTKPMRTKKHTMDPETNLALVKHFDKVAPEKRVRN